LTASFGVTGYSLPWDQIGYWAVKIVTGVPDAIPAEDYATLYKVNEKWPGHAVLIPPALDPQSAHKFGSQVQREFSPFRIRSLTLA
jgi:hypothetical protein